jgi:Ca2+-transporting ATPase
MEHSEWLKQMMGGDNFITYIFERMDLTVFFAGYMVINWWNMFNARVIGKDKSIFDGLFTNAKFMGIAVAILAVTILIVQVGGEVFQTHPLSWKMWAAIIVLTSPIVIVRELYFQLFGKPKK